MSTPDSAAAPTPLPELSGGPGKRVGHLGSMRSGYSCWKFENADPAAVYDFWFMASLQQTATVSHLGLTVPAADGGLVHAVHTAERHIHADNPAVQTITSRHGRIGLVKVSRLVVESYYRSLTEIAAGPGCRIGIYGPTGTLVAPYRALGDEPLPPLPRRG